VGVLFAVFGLVFIAFAIVALLVGSSPSLMLGHVVLGAGFLLYALVTSFREIRDFLAQGVPGRSARYGGNVLLQTVIVIAILVMVAFVSVRNPVKWDWTEAGVHSLSPATLEVLEQIPEDPGIEILAFFVAGSGEGARAVFDRYTYRSDRVKVRFVDPNARPELAQRHDVRTNGVILVCAGPCGAAEGSTRVAQPTEQELTSAIRSVISDKRKVYFVTGHGEASVEDSEASGLSRIKTALEDENIDVATLLLAREPGVPEDADAVVVAGPTQRFLDRELSALDGYLRGGGSILFLSEPFHALNLQAQVREWGIELGDDVIVDQQIQLFAGPKLGVQPIVNEYGSHPITEDMQGRPTLFQLARSVRAADGADVVLLAKTGKASWAETDLERFSNESRVELNEEDERGPVALAAALTLPQQEGAEREGRLVVVGDYDFATNRYVAEFFNADLLLNMINWLVGEEQFISIDRKLPRASRAAMTIDQFRNFRFLSLFVLPEAILLAGLLVWWRRRT
jgi:ABC-type uncharacterized transport system involved in gliding motility auxiliary subunit